MLKYLINELFDELVSSFKDFNFFVFLKKTNITLQKRTWTMI